MPPKRRPAAPTKQGPAAQWALEREQLLTAQAVAHIGNWEVDCATLAVHWSEETYRIFGLEPGSPPPPYATLLDYVHPEDRVRADTTFRASLADRRTHTLEHRLRLPDGTIKVIEARWRIIAGGKDRPVRAVGTCQDITQRRQAEAALRISEDRFRLTFATAGLGIALADRDGRFVEANTAYCTMIGYSLEELRTRDFLSLTHPEDREGYRALVEELLAGARESALIEKRCIRKDGIAISCRMTLSVTQDPIAHTTRIIGVIEDVTVQRTRDIELRRAQALLRVASGIGRFGAWRVMLPEMTLEWSEEIRAIHEVPPGYVPTVETALQFYTPEWRDHITAAFRRCAAEGTPYDLEAEILTARGAQVWVRTIGEAVRDGEGRIAQVQGAFQDISRPKQAEREARELTRQIAETLEHLNDGFVTIDRDWRFTYLNRAAEELVHRPRHELLGRDIWEEFPAMVGTAFERSYRRAAAEGVTVEFDEYYPAPLDAWFEIRAHPTPDGLAVYFQDVTAQRRAQAAIRDQAALLDAAHEAIVVKDLDDCVLYWNKGAERIFGWTAPEAVGRLHTEVCRPDPAKYAEARTILAREGRWEGEMVNRGKDGKECIVSVRWTLVRHADGRPKSVFAINTDITDQKRLESHLLRTQRLESLGTLAGGIAHDLNNVLTPILASIDLLADGEAERERLDTLATIRESAQRGAAMIRQVLGFARGVEGERVAVDPRAIVQDLEGFLRDTLPKGIRLSVDLTEHTPTIVGDATQLHQVLTNLCVNARDAMPSGGRLTIVLSSLPLGAVEVRPHAGVAPGNFVLLEVRDTGIGIPAELQERIFEPFFTTKEFGEGTGLGLSTVHSIVRSHGGFITLDSAPGVGAHFRVYLPTAGAHAPAPAVTATESLPRGHDELILVVDDEPGIRSIVKRTLERFGYRVQVAANGLEALSAYAEARGAIGAVLTDMAMPVMDGPAMILKLKAIDPRARIIGSSGLTSNDALASVVGAGVRHFVPKPYTTEALLTTLSAALTDEP